MHTLSQNYTGVTPKFYAHINNTEGYAVIVMELLGTDLKTYCKQFEDGVPVEIVRKITVEMVSFEWMLGITVFS